MNTPSTAGDAVPRLPPLPGDLPAARLPGWDTRRLVHRPCPACGGEDRRALCVRPDGLAVSQCGGCGMCYLADIPPDDEIARLYEDYGQFKSYRPVRFPPEMARRLAAGDPYIGILSATGGLREKQFLEVGCSHGHFLQLARSAGARVTGLEPDRRSSDFVRGLGIPVVELLPTSPSFDIICAFQVIEHLADPDRWAASVSAALRPGGRLLLALPNGAEAQRVGPLWIGFRVDLEHFNYFSTATLSRMLMRHGLALEQDWVSGQPHLHPAEAPGRAARLLERARAALGIASRRVAAPATADGAFVLTALARRL